MATADGALGADWLHACRRMAGGLRDVLAARPTTAERAIPLGRGEGGDRTLVIDAEAEEVVFGVLEEMRSAGARFTAVSEERGEVGFGDTSVLVVVDPIDGSLNAKRGVPYHALSVAVADGPTVADVGFGFVYDLGTGEEWVARRGEGAMLDGVRLDPSAGERLTDDGRLEILGIESADPRWVAEAMGPLLASAHRLRAVGAIAVTLCQVAAARFDGMASLRRCRAVDAAAGQLIVREAGGEVEFPGPAAPLGVPLDLVPHAPVIAARTRASVERLRAIHGPDGSRLA